MSLRAMPPAMAAALASPVFSPAIFFEGDFADGMLRLWTGGQNVVWAGQTWVGAGLFLGFSGIEEGNGVEANGWSVALSGIPSEMGSLALDQVIQGRMGRLFLGALDEATTLIPDPVLMASGRMDVPVIEDSAETCTISISFESRFIGLKRTREWRWTDQSQQVLFPGDKGFSFVTSIQQADLQWGGQ